MKRSTPILVFLLTLLSTATGESVQRQAIRDPIPALISKLKPVDTLPPSNRLNLAISLPLRNPQALSNFVEQVSNPRSPNFRHYLTRQQFTEKFGPTEGDYQAVIGFAKAQRLNVTRTYSNRVVVDVNGAVADIEKAFHVHLGVYRHPTESRTFYAPDMEAGVDTTVPILEVRGLDNFILPRPMYRLRTNSAVQLPR
ncbi:MAG TPA: protease pro-enzyme activation domain-containing protein, partial [Verrucomicrobiae bacterium]|nr:protease pro-enzyme activation domain-containing protein [Verrucomicrobiae bacterium]